MKLLTKSIVGVATLLSLVFVSLSIASPTIGKTAPGFSALDSYGRSHDLSQYKGSYVVMEWTNDGCPYVGKHYGTGNMQSLQRESTNKGIVWLSVISSAPGRQGYVTGPEANNLTKERNASPSAVLLDPKGKLGQLYSARTTPHMYIIDPKGSLIYKGGIDDIPSARWGDVKKAKNYVRLALNEAMLGKAISKPVTRPYGCSVKYAY